jgi:hypothetical protein
MCLRIVERDMDRREVEDRIQRDCQPFLSLAGPAGLSLYRGMDPRAPEIFEGRVDRARQPKNMPHLLHEAADAWFSRQFGVRFRGAALFCTGSKAQAGVHGKVYRIYPVGCFQFCWSPSVGDLHDWAKVEERLQLPPAEFVAALESLDYREEGFAQAIASGCEVMIACRRYYGAIDGAA